MEENMIVQTGFPSKLLVTKRTLEGVRDAFMDDSDVPPQFAPVRKSLATVGAGKGVHLARMFDPLVNALLVCFQTAEIGKITPTDLTGDDDTALVDLHVGLVISLVNIFTTDFTSAFVLGLGLTLVYSFNVSLE